MFSLMILTLSWYSYLLLGLLGTPNSFLNVFITFLFIPRYVRLISYLACSSSSETIVVVIVVR